MAQEIKRTTVTLNKDATLAVKKAAVEATTRAGMVIKHADIVNYLIKHHLRDAIEGLAAEKSH